MESVKNELKVFLKEHLADTASPFLLKRALFILESAPDNEKGLIEAINQVGRLIALFIDAALAERTCNLLRRKFDGDRGMLSIS